MGRSKAKSEKYPDPELYNGERGDKLDQFIFGLTSKLKLNADRYPNPKSRLLYGYSRLLESAAAQALPRLNAQHDKLVTVEQLIALLKQAFDDPDKQGTAQQFIAGLKIRNRTLFKYLFDFQQHIDATEYDSVTQRFNLENRLSNGFKSC